MAHRIRTGNTCGSSRRITVRKPGSHVDVSRRAFLEGTAGTAAIGLTGLAGCLGDDEPEELTVAYMPIYPDMQYFVIKEEGYLDELSVPVDAREFTDGPSIV